MIHSKLTAETSSKLTSTDITKIPKSLEEVQQFPGEVEIKTVQYENLLCINDKLLNIPNSFYLSIKFTVLV
jgi:hypothetical protein